MSEVKDSAVFQRIVYAQAWEDPAADLRAFSMSGDDDVLSIAASGDNALAFLLAGARSVTAVDFNPSQLNLVELKSAAIRRLSWSDLVEFAGARPSRQRDQLYARVRDALSPAARGFWDGQAKVIRGGIIHAGRFEGMFRIFRWVVLPLMQSRRTVQMMLSCTSLEEQRHVFASRWDSWRWRGLFRLFFSRKAIARTGRSDDHFRQVKVENVGDIFLERARHVFCDLPVRGNWFVEYIMTGGYADLALGPPWLREENHERLRGMLDRLTLHRGALEEWLPTQQESRFSKFYLSDIFEYVSEDATERLLRELWRVSRPGGVLSYRNLLVPRARPANMAESLEPDEALAKECNFMDRSFVYTAHHVERVRK